MSLETKTVEISPVKEFNAGKITVMIGNPYKIFKFAVKTDPVNIPILDEIMTIKNDSIIILLKYCIYGTPNNSKVK